DGMPVSGAIGMHVRDLVMVRLRMGMTASKAMVVGARFSGRCFRGGNEGGLKRERNYGRQHDGSREPSAERLRREAQFMPPEVPFQPSETTPSGLSWERTRAPVGFSASGIAFQIAALHAPVRGRLDRFHTPVPPHHLESHEESSFSVSLPATGQERHIWKD